MNLELLRRNTDRTLADYRAAKQTLGSERTRLEQAKTNLEAIQTAQKLVQEVATRVQEEAHAQIGGLVTRALRAVFGEDAYTFKIVFEQKRGKTEARFVFVRDGEEIDPMSAAGGGVIQVAALALRISCMVLEVPPVRLLLVADEPCSMVSKEYRSRVRNLLETLAEELDMQIILTTHSPDLQIGKVVELK